MNDPKPDVRIARPGEAEEIGTIISGAFQSFRPALPAHVFEPYVGDASDVASRFEEAAVAVLEHEGRIVGTVTYYEDAAREGMGWPSSFAGLRTLAVSPAEQGRGYGRILCDWCIGRARQQGAAALALHTASFMTAACALYESMGFKRFPSHDLVASEVLGFDAALGDQHIIAYLLPTADPSRS
ncbi:MAG: GNAT family N-acetyltransferase [Pseudaminobacter sp.]